MIKAAILMLFCCLLLSAELYAQTNSRFGSATPIKPISPKQPSANQKELYSWRGSSSDADQRGQEECRRSARYNLAAPYIDVFELRRTGNYSSDQYRAIGSFEGACLVEAGYFEFGRKVQPLPVSSSPDFKRYQFEVSVRLSRQPEIRVYNVSGARASYPVR